MNWCDCRAGWTDCPTPILCAEETQDWLRCLREAQEGARILASVDDNYDPKRENTPLTWQALNGGNE